MTGDYSGLEINSNKFLIPLEFNGEIVKIPRFFVGE